MIDKEKILAEFKEKAGSNSRSFIKSYEVLEQILNSLSDESKEYDCPFCKEGYAHTGYIHNRCIEESIIPRLEERGFVIVRPTPPESES